MTNIITAAVTALQTVKTLPAWQYDYGQILKLEGVDLPEAYEVHFANYAESGTTITQIGNADGVTIPDELFQTGLPIFAWLYIHTGEDDGETVYRVLIPVRKRAEPSDDEPTPVEQSAITQAIAALNVAVTETAADALVAEGYARGSQDGTPVESGSPYYENNSKYYSEQAASSASDAAQSESNAATSETNAGNSATAASGSASAAAGSAYDASQSASAASGSADEAEHWATMAEQSAAQSGYLWFYIEDGRLYMDRTSNTQVSFYLEDGKLYMQEVA